MIKKKLIKFHQSKSSRKLKQRNIYLFKNLIEYDNLFKKNTYNLSNIVQIC